MNQRLLRGFYLGGVLLFVGALLALHLRLITLPAPLDYNEPAMVTVTATLAAGDNPYSLANQPARTSLYPVLYNLVVAPLTPLFGNDLPLHRAVSALFLLAAAALCTLVARRRGAEWPLALGAGALIYSVWLYYSSPIAGPNGLGLFLFVASLCIPWWRRFSTGSLMIAGLCAILAFYSKQYFVAGFGYLALYLFLVDSRLKGLLFGVTTLLALLTSLYVVHHIAPYYLDATVFSVKTATGLASSNKRLLNQVFTYLQVYAPLLLLAALALLAALRERRARGFFDSPPDFFGFCCLCSVLTVAVSLGRNQGNYMTYFYQLISPFLVLWVAGLVSRGSLSRYLVYPLLLLAMVQSYSVLPRSFDVDENWPRLRQMVSAADTVLVAPLFLDVASAGGKEILQNGHTRYFSFAADKPEPFKRRVEGETVEALWRTHVKQLHRRIRRQEIDLLLLDTWTRIPDLPAAKSKGSGQRLLKRHYLAGEVVEVEMGDRPGAGKVIVTAWLPRPQD